MKTAIIAGVLLAYGQAVAQVSPCGSDTQLPTTTITSGSTAVYATNYISAGSISGGVDYIVNTSSSDSASVMFQAGSAICLGPGFHAIAGTATTTFHALIGAPPVLVTPSFSPGTGTYSSGQSVTITSSAGARIIYTLDGSAPSLTNGEVYSGPVTVTGAASNPEKLRAVAYWPPANDVASSVGEADYTFSEPAAATPTFSPPAGTYSSTQLVTIQSTTPAATIYYTTNGTTPTTSSSVYSASISVSGSETLEAIATATGYSQSAVGTAAYTITPAAVTPTISPAPGTYSSTQTVTISSTTSSATIYYTTDGTAPSQTHGTSLSNGGTVPVSASETLYAVAYYSGMSLSGEAGGAYSIGSSGGGTSGYRDYIRLGSRVVAVQSYASAPPPPPVVALTPNDPGGEFVNGGQSLGFSATVTPSQTLYWSVFPLGLPVPPYGTVSPSTGMSTTFTSPSSGFSSTIYNLIYVATTGSTGSAASEITIDPTPAPVVSSVSPVNNSTASDSATFTIQLGGGSYPVSYVLLWLDSSDTSPGTPGCLIYVDGSGYLVGDDSWGWSGSSYCTVGSANLTTGSGNTATATISVTFSSPWYGTTQNIYVTDENTHGQADPAGWQAMGWWSIL